MASSRQRSEHCRESCTLYFRYFLERPFLRRASASIVTERTAKDERLRQKKSVVSRNEMAPPETKRCMSLRRLLSEKVSVVRQPRETRIELRSNFASVIFFSFNTDVSWDKLSL